MKKLTDFINSKIIILIIILVVVISVIIFSDRSEERQYISKLNKLYKSLQKATYNIFFDEYSPKDWAKTNEKLYTAYKKRLKVFQDCGRGKGCFPENNYKISNVVLKNSLEGREGMYSVKLQDGSALMFGSTDNGLCNQSAENTFSYCGLIHADINGEMPPDEFGKDYFVFVVNENGIFPAECDYDKCVSDITDKVVHPKYLTRVK